VARRRTAGCSRPTFALRDERYLPFEGAGAIGKLSLQLLGKPRPFDYETISDVVLTIRYTARPEGGNLQNAQTAAAAWLKTRAARLFSLRHELASEWAAFKAQPAAGAATLKFSLTKDHFPYRLSDTTDKVQRLHVFFRGAATGNVTFKREASTIGTNQLADGVVFDDSAFDRTGQFELAFESNRVDDLWLVFDWASGV
jgi:hypothetical protein